MNNDLAIIWEAMNPRAIFDGVDYTQFARLGEANPVPTYWLRTSNEVEQRVLEEIKPS